MNIEALSFPYIDLELHKLDEKLNRPEREEPIVKAPIQLFPLIEKTPKS